MPISQSILGGCSGAANLNIEKKDGDDMTGYVLSIVGGFAVGICLAVGRTPYHWHTWVGIIGFSLALIGSSMP